MKQIIFKAFAISSFISLMSCNSNAKTENSVDSKEATTKEKDAGGPVVEMNQQLKTADFTVSINKFAAQKEVKIGNPLFDMMPEEGNVYYVVTGSYHNTSQMPSPIKNGTLHIVQNGEDNKFESITLLTKGWALDLKGVDADATESMNTAYRVPVTIKGAAYWTPDTGETDNAKYKVNLGNAEGK